MEIGVEFCMHQHEEDEVECWISHVAAFEQWKIWEIRDHTRCNARLEIAVTVKILKLVRISKMMRKSLKRFFAVEAKFIKRELKWFPKSLAFSNVALHGWNFILNLESLECFLSCVSFSPLRSCENIIITGKKSLFNKKFTLKWISRSVS